MLERGACGLDSLCDRQGTGEGWKGTNVVLKVLLEAFLWIKETSMMKMTDMNIPLDSLVRGGVCEGNVEVFF